MTAADRTLDIAVVGAGVAGLVAAAILARRHRVTVFEADERIGGHVHTHDVTVGGRAVAVDTGFIVYNERAYPNFVRLLDVFGVATRATQMSFGVRDERSGLEYGGASLRALLAQPTNALRPGFWVLVRDVLRFGREARELLRPGDESLGLRAYLEARRYSRAFIEQYAIPIGSAIWSAPPAAMADFPARHFVRFFEHHGVLDVRSAPTWRTVSGGSRRYLEPLCAPFRERIRTGTPVACVARAGEGVAVVPVGGPPERFDRAVLATHSDQALALLEQPTAAEREVLGAIPYQRNDALLHTDPRLMPRARRAWSSWNSLVPAEPRQGALVTYYMNLLQGLDVPEPLLVTLGGAALIDPAKVLRRMVYHHPAYSAAAIAAQQRHAEIDGVHGVHFCGAYWGYGFHEDGVDSALAVTREFGLGLEALA